MPPFTSVLCAVDGSPVAERVVRHAAAFAGVSGGDLTVLTVTDGDLRQSEARLEVLISSALPDGTPYLAEPRLRVVRIPPGDVADAILAFSREGYDLVVAGTHARGGFSRWLLGSTSRALLERATIPTLLIPPGDLDIVSLSSLEVRLNPGAVIAAIDLVEQNPRQLEIAAETAALARQPLVLMTVAPPDVPIQEAERALGERARALGPANVQHLVVRRGAVAEEIGRAAVLEPAGLVVMGLRPQGHGLPGDIAAQVLRRGDTVVLAVPAILPGPTTRPAPGTSDRG